MWLRVRLTMFGDNRTWTGARKLFTNIYTYISTDAGENVTSHHLHQMPGERDYARNNARYTKARKTTYGLDGQHQYVDKTSRRRVNQNNVHRTEINGESTSMVWPTLRSRTAKEPNEITWKQSQNADLCQSWSDYDHMKNDIFGNDKQRHQNSCSRPPKNLSVSWSEAIFRCKM